MKKITSLALILLLLISGLTGCMFRPNLNNHELVGTWVWEVDPSFEYVFHGDGHATRGFVTYRINSFRWSVNRDGELVMNHGRDYIVEHWRWSIQDDVLTITGLNAHYVGQTFRYFRHGSSAFESHECQEYQRQSLVGAWECRDTTTPHFWLCFLIFDESGRFIDGDGDMGWFVISGNNLTLNFDFFDSFTFYFSVTPDQLMISGHDVQVLLYRTVAPGAETAQHPHGSHH